MAIVDDKLADLVSAATGITPAFGGLDPHIITTGTFKTTLLSKLAAIQAKWAIDSTGPTFSAASNTTAKLNLFISFVKSNATSGFTECPNGAAICPDEDKRNASGELIARAESMRFFTCGAANGCYNTFP